MLGFVEKIFQLNWFNKQKLEQTTEVVEENANLVQYNNKHHLYTRWTGDNFINVSLMYDLSRALNLGYVFPSLSIYNGNKDCDKCGIEYPVSDPILDKLTDEFITTIRNIVNIFDYGYVRDDIITLLSSPNLASTQPTFASIINSWSNRYFTETIVDFERLSEKNIASRQRYIAAAKIVRDIFDDNFNASNHVSPVRLLAFIVGVFGGSSILPLTKKSKKLARYFNTVVATKWNSYVSGVDRYDDIDRVFDIPELKALYGLIGARKHLEPDWDYKLFNNMTLDSVDALFNIDSFVQYDEGNENE